MTSTRRSFPTRSVFAAALLLLFAAPASGQDPIFARVEAILRKYDLNGDGVVDKTESKSADFFRRCDADKNGMVGAPEILAAEGGLLDEKARRRLLLRLPVARTFGDLVLFDADGDAALDYDELLTLVFAICDGGNPDRRLTRNECFASVAPFNAAFKNGWLAKDFKKLDVDGDGFILMRDFDLPAGFVKALDLDGDGKASFDELAIDGFKRRGGKVARYPAIVAYFAKNDAAKASEWPGESADFKRFDEDRDGRVTTGEFDRGVRSLREVLELASDFITRFDLDGDGKVSRVEFTGSELIFARLDKDADGVVGPKDR